jgi:hypothetical protein
VATLIRNFGDIDIAEDAVQEAFAVALRDWASDGLPPNPGGWITTTARNRAIDRLRRESRGRELLSEVGMLSPRNDDGGMPEEAGPVEDDRLRLIFTCCNPALLHGSAGGAYPASARRTGDRGRGSRPSCCGGDDVRRPPPWPGLGSQCRYSSRRLRSPIRTSSPKPRLECSLHHC